MSGYLLGVVALMVNKNLAYVSAEDLDKMDILTTDLDQPPNQLKLEVNKH